MKMKRKKISQYLQAPQELEIDQHELGVMEVLQMEVLLKRIL